MEQKNLSKEMKKKNVLRRDILLILVAEECLFWKTSANGCFSSLMKALFDQEISFWTCYEEHISCAFY